MSIISGTITKTREDGSEVECAYIVDTEAGTVVQCGGEGQITAEDESLIREMMGLTEGDADGSHDR